MQRVAMAQAILGSPKVLILDEPFSGLDPVGRKEFRDLLLELKNAGTTLFMSSHILGDVEFLCDRASIMVKGELRGVFNLRDLSRGDGAGFELALQSCAATQAPLDAELRESASETSDNGHILRLKFTTRYHAEAALRRAMGAGLAVESFEPLHQNLEDIFMSLLGKK